MELRLASARRRVRAFVDQIVELEASDFPHRDGLDALGVIRKELEYYLNDFLDTLPLTLSDAVVDGIIRLNAEQRLATMTAGAKPGREAIDPVAAKVEPAKTTIALPEPRRSPSTT